MTDVCFNLRTMVDAIAEIVDYIITIAIRRYMCWGLGV